MWRNVFSVFKSYIPEIFYLFSPKHNKSKKRSSLKGQKAAFSRKFSRFPQKACRKFSPNSEISQFPADCL